MKKILLFLIPIGLLLILTGCQLAFTYYSTNQTVEMTIATQSMEIAKSTAAQIDVEAYQRWLQNPHDLNDDYWKNRLLLSDVHSKIGAKYVYTVRLLDNGTTEVMTLGEPKDSPDGPDIGEPCTVTRKDLEPALTAQIPYHTGIIHDKKYGVYLTAGAPILDKGKIIGFLQIDTGAEVVDTIGQNVIRNSLPTFAIDVVLVAALMLLYSFLQRWYQRNIRRAVGETEQTYQEEFRGFVASVRSLRHDLANHLQVLYGLLNRNQPDKARDYMEELLQDMKMLDLPLQVSNPALLVLFQSKYVRAEAQGIEMTFDVRAEDPGEGMQSLDLIKLMSNLIDNACDAALVNPAQVAPHVRIAAQKVGKFHRFEVENTGTLPDESEIQRFFQPGYSTKKATDRPRGYGLYIVNSIVERYGGELHVSCADGVTRFAVLIPMQGGEKRYVG